MNQRLIETGKKKKKKKLNLTNIDHINFWQIKIRKILFLILHQTSYYILKEYRN